MKHLIVIIALASGLSLNGQNVGNFELRNIDNEFVSFNDIKGEKITVIDFWASWCKPCMKAMPELNKFYESYKDNGLQVIGINCDSPRSAGKVEPLVKSLNIQYPTLIDMDKTVMNDLNLQAFPTLLIVNPEGDVLWTHEGFVSSDTELIKAKIEKYLNE